MWSAEEQGKLKEPRIDSNKISREVLTALVKHFKKDGSLYQVHKKGIPVEASQYFARKVRNATHSGSLDWLLTEKDYEEVGRWAGNRSLTVPEDLRVGNLRDIKDPDSTDSEIAAKESPVGRIRIEPDIGECLGSQSGESPRGLEHIADMTWICEQLRTQVNLPVLQLFRSPEIDQASGRFWSAKGWTPDPESTFDVNWGVSIDRSFNSPFISLVVEGFPAYEQLKQHLSTLPIWQYLSDWMK